MMLTNAAWSVLVDGACVLRRGRPFNPERCRRLLHVIAGCLVAASASAADPAGIEATTTTGERVRLLPSGRWEYVDAEKAARQKTVAAAYEKQRDDERNAEQGGLLGIGRKIRPGDPDYNRGSLGGKSH